MKSFEQRHKSWNLSYTEMKIITNGGVKTITYPKLIVKRFIFIYTPRGKQLYRIQKILLSNEMRTWESPRPGSRRILSPDLFRDCCLVKKWGASALNINWTKINLNEFFKTLPIRFC